MRKEITLLVMTLLVLTPCIMAAEQTQYNAGITPDSPFYGVDRLFEKIRLALTFNKESKVNYRLQLSEERIAEMDEMVAKGNENALDVAIRERNKITEGIEKDSVGVSEQVRAQIRERLETHAEEMNKIDGQANLKSKISLEVQNTNSLKTRIRGLK